jgi:K+-sensing histidine kinase KdpD
MPLSARRVNVYTMTIPAVALGAWAGRTLSHAGAVPFALMPLTLVVAISAWYGGFGPGVFSLIQAAVATAVFFTATGRPAQFTGPGETGAFFVFVGGWLVFCFLVGRLFQQRNEDRRQRVAADATASQSHRLAQLTAALAQARTPRAAVEAAVQESLHALKADAAVLLFTSRDGTTAELARAVGYPREFPSTVSLAGKGPLSDALGRAGHHRVGRRAGRRVPVAGRVPRR